MPQSKPSTILGHISALTDRVSKLERRPASSGSGGSNGNSTEGIVGVGTGKITVSAVAPTDPQLNDLWIQL